LKLIVALLVFGIIVMFHEFGHFIVAKKNGIIVEEFAIGMGPKLFGIKGKETEYTIRLFPIGGACMMLGEDTAEEVLEGSFNSKSVWARIAVVAAGPFFNFIMAFFCALLIIGMTGYTSGEILEVADNSPAMTAGLEAGDLITRADKTAIHTFTDFRMFVSLNQGRTCTITYKRDGISYQTEVTPRLDEDGVYRIGITGGVQEKPGPLGTIISSFYEVKSNINLVIKSLEMMIQGQVSKDDVSGPVGMFSVIGDSYEAAAQYGLREVILTIADLILLLSANLGVMNLLPIPALDGGRLVFLVIEAVRGKPVSRDKEGFVHMIGFILLMVLMVLIMFNDLSKIFGF
jgi:regulator of sigma E protease